MQKNQDVVQLNKKAYNSVAGLFSSTREYLWEDLKALSTQILDGQLIADIGCGNGRLFELFSQKNIKYVGVDQSEKLIEIAKEKYSQNKFLIGDMRNLPLEDEIFDHVFCIAALCHIPPKDQEKTIKELYKILKPGGVLTMLNWNAKNDWVQNKISLGKYTTEDQKSFFVPWRNGPGDILAMRYYYGFDLKELKNLLENVGFIVEENYFSKKGKKVGVELGENIVTVAKKKTT